MPTGGSLAASGGAIATGGRANTGGLASTGGTFVVTGGSKAMGGSAPTGGLANITGGLAPIGGASATGGSRATGGALPTGGSNATGGMASTGGNRATGGTSAGGASSYNPCPTNGDPCKILPFGDSITHGYASSDDAGYRSQLFKLIVAANQNVTFTGSLSNGPSTVSGQTFPKNHEGHDGYTIDSGYSTYNYPGISSLIPSPAFSTIPDIVLLMIGTNDITSTNAASTASTRLDALLGKIVAAAPNALIVVATLTPLGYSSADYNTYNSKIPGLVQARAAQGQHIVSVDMSKMPTSDLGNGVHPSDQGYAYMANIWYPAISGLLP